MFDCQLLTLQTASNRALLRRSNLRSRQVGFLFVISVCLLVLVSTSVPYFLQWRGVPPGQHFGGLICHVRDQNCYLMWMHQAKDGHLVWQNLMTTDPHEPFVTSSLWLVLGWMARSGLSMLAVYHLSRAVLITAFLIAMYALLGALLHDSWQRRAALAIIALGSGVLWAFYALSLQWYGQAHAGTGAARIPELLAWPSMAAFPHFTAALAAMMTVYYLTLAAYRRRHLWLVYAGSGGLLLAVLASFHVYDVVTVTAVLIGHWLIARRTGKAPAHAVAVLLAIILPGVLTGGLFLWITNQSPIAKGWGSAVVLLSKSPFAYAVVLGLPLLLALADHRKILHWQKQDVSKLLVPAWLLTNALIIFTDGVIPFERRLVMGIQIPIVTLAVRNWAELVVPRLRAFFTKWISPGRQTAALWLPWAVLIVATWPDTALHTAVYGGLTGRRAGYVSSDLLVACEHLEALPAGQGVLCERELGNWVPRFSGQAAYVGHWSLTPDCERRDQEVEQFFDPQADNQWRQGLLAGAHCNYVLARAEQRQALHTAVSSGLLVPELVTPTMTLYSVVSEATETGPKPRQSGDRS